MLEAATIEGGCELPAECLLVEPFVAQDEPTLPRKIFREHIKTNWRLYRQFLWE
jgi:hypothetical protein